MDLGVDVASDAGFDDAGAGDTGADSPGPGTRLSDDTPDMGLAGWKQLILWSIEHACLGESERGLVMKEWETQWEVFLDYVLATYASELVNLE